MPELRIECRYCDNPMSPRNCDGDLVCSNCGAEWAAAKCVIEVSDLQLERERREQEEYDQWIMAQDDYWE
ncbi:hypothetical protein [Enterococcus sp. AZ109]|uniref:hypothetical protein n=1 Tax=Enterococcus sp. AZ109 TaxID=2774634 RepID=UPI003F287B96